MLGELSKADQTFVTRFLDHYMGHFSSEPGKCNQVF